MRLPQLTMQNSGVAEDPSVYPEKDQSAEEIGDYRGPCGSHLVDQPPNAHGQDRGGKLPADKVH